MTVPITMPMASSTAPILTASGSVSVDPRFATTDSTTMGTVSSTVSTYSTAREPQRAPLRPTMSASMPSTSPSREPVSTPLSWIQRAPLSVLIRSQALPALSWVSSKTIYGSVSSRTRTWSQRFTPVIRSLGTPTCWSTRILPTIAAR